MAIAAMSDAQAIPPARLLCVVKDLAGGNTTLTWAPTGTQPCGSFGAYIVYGSTSQSGPYSQIGLVGGIGSSSFTHTGAASGTWYYYIVDSFNCVGATYTTSDTILNESNPKTPVIASADVQPDGTVKFSWRPSTSPQAKYYVVQAVTPSGQIIAIDTAYGRMDTSVIDRVQDPTNQSVCYTIVAYDSCAGNQPSAYNTKPHCTMLLQYVAPHCDRNIKLSWNKYTGFASGALKYYIIVRKNGGPYTTVAMVDSGSTTYGYADFNDGDSLDITVQAISADDTFISAHSSYIHTRASIVQPPAYVYITNLTVDVDNNILVTWLTDPKAELLLYDIRKSEDCMQYPSGDLRDVTFPKPALDTFTARDVTPQDFPYCYKVIGVDSCQGRKESPYGKTINLVGELTDYYEVTVNWNAFELNGARVMKYNLYRDYGTGYQLIASVAPNVFTYKDSVYQYLTVPGHFCYRIEGVYDLELPDVPYSDTLSSWSNIVCVDHRPIIYIPNAFVPTGMNNVFKPRIIFGDPSNYSLTIFNRYGGKIFESHDPNIGWDGTDHGKIVQQGGYAYLIKFIAADGANIEREGIVLLVGK